MQPSVKGKRCPACKSTLILDFEDDGSMAEKCFQCNRVQGYYSPDGTGGYTYEHIPTPNQPTQKPADSPVEKTLVPMGSRVYSGTGDEGESTSSQQPKRRIIDEELKDYVVQLRSLGNTVPEIVEVTRLSDTSVARILQQRGVTSNRRRLTDDQKAEIYRRNQAGEKQFALAREFGVVPNTISTVIRKGREGAPWVSNPVAEMTTIKGLTELAQQSGPTVAESTRGLKDFLDGLGIQSVAGKFPDTRVSATFAGTVSASEDSLTMGELLADIGTQIEARDLEHPESGPVVIDPVHIVGQPAIQRRFRLPRFLRRNRAPLFQVTRFNEFTDTLSVQLGIERGKLDQTQSTRSEAERIIADANRIIREMDETADRVRTRIGVIETLLTQY